MVLIIITLAIILIVFIVRSSNKSREAEQAKKKAVEEQRLKDEAVKLAEIEHRLAQEARIAENLAKAQMTTMRPKAKESRAQQGYKDGYIYILNNPNSFGQHIHKVGMTRREDPFVRVGELNSASVPFDFDPISFIKVEKASDVETELHRSLDQFRVNKHNKKKEFFNIPLEELELHVKHIGLEMTYI